ncbi:hypothetical protein PV682_28030 [Streptomyces niveiscabiei]|uniref:hypothetical protein n=1 Tax=Streptomyces niveiscabiei TaxID=164115 RepID=UPI0029AB944E|nr:hypothetical protein [Streptomyces niveiscabiei]MDX3385293.1 hypothetical protein [Streptomyces niveiscabiei]
MSAAASGRSGVIDRAPALDIPGTYTRASGHRRVHDALGGGVGFTAMSGVYGRDRRRCDGRAAGSGAARPA